MSTARGSVAQREAAAATPDLAPAEQMIWAGDSSARVRRVVASRADLPAQAAHRLAGDADRRVRELLAANGACPPEVLIALLDDEDFHVRWNAAQNPAATIEVHHAALTAANPDVAQAIGQLGDVLAGEVIDALVSHPVAAAREQLATATGSEPLLQRLAADPAPTVRAAVALSHSATDGLLRQLATDPLARVRAAVACSLCTPRDVVLELTRDKSALVRWWVFGLRQDDPEVVNAMVDDPDPLIADQARSASTWLNAVGADRGLTPKS